MHDLHQPLGILEPLFANSHFIISMCDPGTDRLSVANDVEAVLGKIEFWHQGPIAGFKDQISGRELSVERYPLGMMSVSTPFRCVPASRSFTASRVVAKVVDGVQAHHGKSWHRCRRDP